MQKGVNSLSEYFTIEMLGTSAGMIAFVTIVVQFLKLPMDKVFKIPTRFVVLGIALLLQVIYQCLILRNYSVEAFFLSFVNSIVVALGSMGAYDVTFAEIDKCNKENDDNNIENIDDNKDV